MGYVFRGFLTRSPHVARAAVQRWPLCESKHETVQMDGFLVRCPNEDDLHPTEGDDAYARVIEQIAEVRDGLESLSAEFPDEVIVYIEVTCFGGTCTNAGFHVLSGRTIATFDAGPDEVDITEILRPMGISFGEDQYFKPFTRGYFERDKLQELDRPASQTTNQAREASEMKGNQVIQSKSWWKFWQH
jgi:hypothetical protein